MAENFTINLKGKKRFSPSEPLSPLPEYRAVLSSVWGVPDRPFAAMMAYWKKVIADEEGSVEKFDEIKKEKSPSPSTPDEDSSPPFFPFEMFGDTWDQCVAEAEIECQEASDKIRNGAACDE